MVMLMEQSVAPCRCSASLHAACEPTVRPHVRICHDHGGPGQSTVELHAEDTRERWLLLRANGPHPQTVLFRRMAAHDATVWSAPVHLGCGQYTLHVRLLAVDPLARWNSSLCLQSWAQHSAVYRHTVAHEAAGGVQRCGGGTPKKQ